MGIDNGTSGLSVVLVDESSMEVVATGEAGYGMVPGLEPGCYEQRAEDWEAAMASAMKQIQQSVPDDQVEVLAIGISGQMHGEVLMGDDGRVLQPVRLWCDSRNEEEGQELTEQLRHKVPKRMACARFLWTVRNRPKVAAKTKHITTPAGWMSYRLTQQHTLGIGDASGVFPIDQNTLNYDLGRLETFDRIVQEQGNGSIAPLSSLLPKVCVAGEPAGCLSDEGARLLGLKAGIPVAPAEGDQPAAMAGSLIGRAGSVSLSFGTSVCANSVGDRPFKGVSGAVDHFCAADGKPIHMVWLRNGTTFMNTVVESYGSLLLADNDSSSSFEAVMPLVVEAPPDCGSLLALPFMDDEPGLAVSRGGSAMVVGWNDSNATPGNVARAALVSTCFNLKRGSEVLDEQGYPRTELVFTGGLAKTPECGQILADVFDAPVLVLSGSSDEGSSFGAALLAGYLYEKLKGSSDNNHRDWPSFLTALRASGPTATRYEPIPDNVSTLETMYARYKKLLALVPAVTDAVAS